MFERFTTDGRSTVLRAQEEARSLGHDYIGTEHLLLAMVAVDGPPVGAVLGPYGITYETVRADILGLVGRGEGAGPGHIPFTPRSKKVLELSLREALKLKHKAIEPAHILLGLVREGEGVAAQLLVQHGADLRRLRPEIVARLGTGKAHMVPMHARAAPDMTRGSLLALDRARHLAGGSLIGSQHLLLGLLEAEDSLAARALGALGITTDAVEKQLSEIDPSGTFDEPPEHAAARRTSFEVDENVVTVRMEDPDLAAKLGAAMRERGKPVTILGTEVPAFETFWRAVRPALDDMSVGFSKQVMARRLRDTEEVTLPGNWIVAEYSVNSFADGLKGRLRTNHRYATNEDVRAFLGGWLAARQSALGEMPGPDYETGCVRLTLQVGHARDVHPDAPEPLALAVTNVSFGPGPAPPECPRVALGDLVTFALGDLGAPGEPR